MCPFCGDSASSVKDSRIFHNVRYRRRECSSCDREYMTKEVIASVVPMSMNELNEEENGKDKKIDDTQPINIDKER